MSERKGKRDRKSDQAGYGILAHLGTAAASMAAIGAVLVWLGKTTFVPNAEMAQFKDKFQSDVATLNQDQALNSLKIENIEKDVKEIKENGREVLRILQRRRP